MLIKKIPNGVDGIAETVTAIIAVAHDPESTEQIRHMALYICESAQAKSDYEKVTAIFNWVRDHIKYYRDPIYREFVQEPLWLIREGSGKTFKAAGDCFIKGTKVLRQQGHQLVPIESLKEGDFIWGYNKWSKVTKVWGDKGALKTSLIKLNNGSSIRLTADHKVWIATCNRHKSACSCPVEDRNLERIRVSELQPKMIVIQPEKIAYGSQIADPDINYIEGLYLSDGWCEDYRFAISGKDGSKKESQKDAVRKICENKNIPHDYAKRYIRINDSEWTNKIRNMGAISTEKHALSLDFEELSSNRLLEGILADAGKNTNGNGSTFTTKSRELWLQTRVLLKSAGFTCSETYIEDHGGLGKNPIWRLGIRDKNRSDGKRQKLLRVTEIIRDDKIHECFDIETEDHFVWLPEADWTVSQCDDHTAVNMALLSVIGFQTRAIVTEDPSNPSPGKTPYWAHIYCEVLTSKNPNGTGKKEWIPVDTSMWFLKMGEKVGGKHTLIYPSDIPPDVFFDAAKDYRYPGRIKGGLGFVGKAIALGSKYVDKVMNERITKGGFNFGFSVNGLGGTGLGNASQNGLGQFSIISSLISTASGFGQSLINRSLQKDLAKKQLQITQLQTAAQLELAKKAQELEFQSQQLEAERSALIASEQASFNRLRDASKTDKWTAAALVGVPLAAVFIAGFLRRKG